MSTWRHPGQHTKPAPDQRQVSRARGLTAAGRAAYEIEARALALRIADAPPFPDATAHDRAVELARLVLRLTEHREGSTVPETGGASGPRASGR